MSFPESSGMGQRANHILVPAVLDLRDQNRRLEIKSSRTAMTRLALMTQDGKHFFESKKMLLGSLDVCLNGRII